MRTQLLSMSLMAIVLVFAVSGCGSKVHDEKSGDLEFGESKIYTIDAPKSQQKVVVKLTSDDEVNLIVALQKDLDGDMVKRESKALGESTRTKSATIEVTVPEGQAFSVVLTAVKKKTSFKLKIDSV